MSEPAADQADHRLAMERASGEVSDVLLTVEFALERAKRAKKNVDKDGLDVNASLALGEAARDLERVRKRLMQDTYFAVDTRLI